MNTMSLIWGFIVGFVIVWGIIKLFNLRSRAKRANQPDDVKTLNYIIIAVLLISFVTVVSILNIYGIARIPVNNEMQSRMPETYTPTDRPIKPPTNGSIQPPSQPAFEDHKAQMDKLKRDGL